MFLALLAVMLVLLPAGCGSSGAADSLPPGFGDELVARVSRPTALAFTPDGRTLVATQPGVVHVIDRGGELLPRPALDLSRKVCTERERGMVGVAVDPAFERNRYVYVYYTFKKFGACPVETARVPVNRVARYVLRSDSTFDPATETLLLDNIPSYGATHNGGDIQFGKDRLLYVGVGDGGEDYARRTDATRENPAARDLNVLLGKIVRITANGGVPEDNPFAGSDAVPCARTGPVARGRVCQEIYAWGLRNPFRLAFDPNAKGTRFFVNDVGQGAWEEINEAEPGADYGWNLREGLCPREVRLRCNPAPPGMVDPLFAYGHEHGCTSITGGAFVPNGAWPRAYDGAYLFADFVCGRIFLLREKDGSVRVSDFHSALGPAGVVALTFRDRERALYYASYISGEVRRIRFR